MRLDDGGRRNMHLVIRNERPEDYRKVEEVAREAFWNLYFPGCAEHCTIHELRQDDAFIPELTFVLEKDGEIIGSIFYSHSKVVAADGTEYPTISFGPVAIHPAYHRKGYGRQLIEHSLTVATEKGHRGVLTLGYPYHYEPYGFKGGKVYGISMPDGQFYKGLLALPLYEGAFKGIQGYAVFAEALDTTEEAYLEYDKQFPPKEKKVEPSQQIYADTVGLLDE